MRKNLFLRKFPFLADFSYSQFQFDISFLINGEMKYKLFYVTRIKWAFQFLSLFGPNSGHIRNDRVHDFRQNHDLFFKRCKIWETQTATLEKMSNVLFNMLQT